MLIESIVRKTLELKDHRVISVVDMGGTLWVELASKRKRGLICSHSGRRARIRDGLRERTWWHVLFWGACQCF
jgi:hypothetical protein